MGQTPQATVGTIYEVNKLARKATKEYISNYRKWLRKLHLQHEQHPHER